MSANIAKIAKVTRIFHASWKHPWQISQKYKMWQNSRLRKKRKPRRAPKCPQISQKYQMQQNSRLTKKRSQEGPWNVCKNHKSNKDFSCCLKHPWQISQISQKYKMWQNSRLSRPEMSPNIAKIAKVTRIFLAMWKDWATNMAKIARITNLTKYFA